MGVDEMLRDWIEVEEELSCRGKMGREGGPEARRDHRVHDWVAMQMQFYRASHRSWEVDLAGVIYANIPPWSEGHQLRFTRGVCSSGQGCVLLDKAAREVLGLLGLSPEDWAANVYARLCRFIRAAAEKQGVLL